MASLNAGDVVRIRGDRWRIARQVSHGACALIEAQGCDGSNRGERASFILPAETVERFPACDRPRVVSPARWRRVARALLGDAVPSPASLLTAARARFDVLPFQLEPALAMTSGAACRLLIADEVGLGKTIQAALVVSELLARATDGRALIVTPAGLREQWQRELERLFDTTATIVDGASLSQMSNALSGFNPWAAHRVLITSVDFVKRPEVLRSLEPLVWDVVVFDEAHTLAGSSDRAAAAGAIANRSRHVVLLTATPHSGDESAFERLCSIGDINRAFPLMRFRRTRADAALASGRRTAWLRVRPNRAERAVHRALREYARAVLRSSTLSAPRLAMTLLARRAGSSAASLAISVERRLALLSENAPTNAQLALPMFDESSDEVPDALLAAPGLPDSDREREWLLRVLALARVASRDGSKVRALRRLLRRARRPVLVFTEYRDTLQHVSDQLRREVVHLHGGLTPAERTDAAARFTSGNAMVMLATDAASEGLNLHSRCHLVVNLELPWSPTRLEQRIGRIDRIGQRRRVHAVNIVARGTIEDRVVERLLRRGREARASLEANGAGPDFVEAARAEAARLNTARALLRVGAPALPLQRTAATHILKRTGSAHHYWAVRVRFGGVHDDLPWEALFGVHVARSRKDLRSTADVRRALDTTEWVETAIADAIDQVLERTRSVLESIAALNRQREEAIVEVLRQDGARLAATLMQRTLFDRRADRAAAAQQSIAEDVLRRCAGRLQRLEALTTTRARDREVVFAVVIG